MRRSDRERTLLVAGFRFRKIRDCVPSPLSGVYGVEMPGSVAPRGGLAG